MILFTLSAECQSRRHCQRCRDRTETGRQFRDSLRSVYRLPDNATENMMQTTSSTYNIKIGKEE